jgi:hypothetical protein
MPPAAVAATLSRLARAGEIKRMAKGVYYRPRETAFGWSRPAAGTIRRRASKAVMQPRGLTAASALGLTTQNPGVQEFATTSAYAPAAYRDSARVVTRRPASRAALGPREAALLEVLRDRVVTSDLTPEQTIKRVTELIRDPDVFGRLVSVAGSEPPRVRAMLGALGEQAQQDAELLDQLRRSLNGLSRFDFGVLARLPTAGRWQAKNVR